MVLESTIICIDNSEFMRNGDFLPTRLQALQDAVGLVTQSKLRSNPESNVGLLTLGGLEVLTTLTTDTGKILAKLHAVQPAGKLRLISGIKIAHLALKHRQGRNHKTRIVAFIGSPVEADEKELMKVAKKLKKEKVNVDIVSFGEDQVNKDILEKFVNTVRGKDGAGSNLLNISMGPHLSDALLSSAIIQGEDGSGAIAAGGGFEFGVDPNEDPELALALRVSMEEQRARQEAEAAVATRESAAEGSNPPVAAAGGLSEEDAMLQRALSMSMETDDVNLDAMTEEEQIAYAMRMSMAEHDGAGAGGGVGTEQQSSMEVDDNKDEDKDYSEALQDPAFIQSVLENLPGVDPNSEAVQEAMGAMMKKEEEEKKKKKEDKK